MPECINNALLLEEFVLTLLNLNFTNIEMDEELVEEINNHTILHWNYRGYKSVPAELKIYGNHIKEIYLKQNQLEKLPHWEGCLKNLCNLYLNGNFLKDLSSDILLLKNLTVLDISDNKLDRLPDNLNNLSNLIELRCDNNKLTKLPEKIGFLGALSYLSVENNRLETLPQSLGCCFSLESLNVKGNKLKYLPGNLVFLPQLDILAISKNELLFLPSISFIDNPIINFSHNPCVNYLSYDVFSDGFDPHMMQTNSNILSYTHDTNFQNVLQRSDVVEMRNVVVEVTHWKKYGDNWETLLVLPDPLRDTYDEENTRVPSLFELLLRHCYSSPSTENRTRFFYKNINKSALPNKLRDLLIQGPSALCQHCRGYIFVECVLWVIVQLLMCNICRETEILTTVYFCSTACARMFLHREKDFDGKISVHKLKWTRVN